MTRIRKAEVRAMLRRRASDISEVPPKLLRSAAGDDGAGDAGDDDVGDDDVGAARGPTGGDRYDDPAGGPAGEPDLPVGDGNEWSRPPQPRHGTRWLVPAAAVAVLVIAGGIIGVRQMVGDHTPGSASATIGASPHSQAAAATAAAGGAETGDGSANGRAGSAKAGADRGAPSSLAAAARPGHLSQGSTAGQARGTAQPKPTGQPTGANALGAEGAAGAAGSGSSAGRFGTAAAPGASAARQACTASLPTQWRSALGATGSAYGAQSARPLSVTAGGTVLVARDFGHGGKRDVVLVGSHSTAKDSSPTASKPLFTVSDPDKLGIENAYLYRHWLVVSVGSNPRPPKGEKPGSSPMPNVVHLYVIDTDSGSRTEIASGRETSSATESGSQSKITSAVLLGGKVYWDVEAGYGAESGKIQSYDLATGATRTVYSGPHPQFYASSVSAVGIVTSSKTVGAPSLPDAVTRARTHVSDKWSAHVQTDGTAYAWIVDSHVLGWWTPRHPSPTYVRLSKPLPSSSYPDVIAVAGPDVIIDGGRMVDMVTGAVTTLPKTPAHQPAVLARGATIVGVSEAGKGHWDNGYWVDPQSQVTITDTADLPEIIC